MLLHNTTSSDVLSTIQREVVRRSGTADAAEEVAATPSLQPRRPRDQSKCLHAFNLVKDSNTDGSQHNAGPDKPFPETGQRFSLEPFHHSWIKPRTSLDLSITKPYQTQKLE